MRTPTTVVALLIAVATTAQAATVQGAWPTNFFCEVVNHFITDVHDEQQATSFCASYLHLSTVSTSTTTRTLTATRIATTTAMVTAISTVTDATSSDYTTTVSSTTPVATVTTFETVGSSTTTITLPLTQCGVPAPPTKRAELEERAIAKPTFWPSSADPWLSEACSCLSIPPSTSTATQTVSKVTTRTRTRTRTRTTTQTTIFTPVTSLATTTTVVDGTITVTQTTTDIATSTAYSNIALWNSNSRTFGSVMSGPEQGEGVYFNEYTFRTAAMFSFSGSTLFYDSKDVRGGETATGYVILPVLYNRYLGASVTCSLSVDDPSNGCVLSCNAGLSTGTSGASGNNEFNYNGAWGLSGVTDTDEFIVYAVGQS